MKKVAVIMGSKNDLPKVQGAIDTLADLQIPYEVHVFSAHRTPVPAQRFAESARSEGFGVLIAAAGKAAHLAGALAANTTLPIIGIPVNASSLGGIDALLSTVQMPSGVPVASVGIDGAVNAALLSAEILSLTDDDLADRLAAKRHDDMLSVIAADESLQF